MHQYVLDSDDGVPDVAKPIRGSAAASPGLASGPVGATGATASEVACSHCAPEMSHNSIVKVCFMGSELL